MNILLVEDNESVRESLAAFIRERGHTVLESGDGKHALEVLKQQPVHIVISDIKMPRMDGNELLRRIKGTESLKDIEVLLFTGHGDVKGAVEAMRAGAYEYLLKPVDVKELDTIIQRIGEFIHLRNENRKLTEDFQQEVKRATKDIEAELIEVRKAFARQMGSVDVGIFSTVMQDIFGTAAKLHENPDIPVLIEGETGTGKELVAHSIHYGTGDIITPFIDLNCAAISPTLFESELFGYAPGSFTGGNPKGQKGKLELAQDGTIFLDEITEMPIEHQAKLLRVLQERTYYQVGGSKKLVTNARFIGATNQNVARQVKEGSFRQDLFYRLNIGYINIPPLRERRQEILPLATLFLNELRQKKKTRFERISGAAAEMMQAYHWPGNVRELKNMIERILLYWNDVEITPEHLKACFIEPAATGDTYDAMTGTDLCNLPLPDRQIDLNKITLDIVKKAYEKHEGNQTRTAQYLGISVRVLHTYLRRLHQ
ncbi:sigma-54-dependent Fis family transcriptional regulator [bacterium]|nr:sigma-54-dependent Fis family transcriptional regulator [bacterium]